MERSDYSESSGDSVMDVEFSGIDTRSVFVDPPPGQAEGRECHPLHRLLSTRYEEATLEDSCLSLVSQKPYTGNAFKLRDQQRGHVTRAGGAWASDVCGASKGNWRGQVLRHVG